MEDYEEHGGQFWSFILVLTGVLLIVTGIGIPIGILFLAIGALTFGTTETMKEVVKEQESKGDTGGAIGVILIAGVILMALMACLMAGIFELT